MAEQTPVDPSPLDLTHLLSSSRPRSNGCNDRNIVDAHAWLWRDLA